MGARYYMTIPHSGHSVCRDYVAAREAGWPLSTAGPGAWFEFGLDLRLSPAQIDALLVAMDAESQLAEASVRTFHSIRAALQAAARCWETDVPNTTELALSMVHDAFVELADRVGAPSYQLRKKYHTPSGPLVVAPWVLDMAVALRRHRACAEVVTFSYDA